MKKITFSEMRRMDAKEWHDIEEDTIVTAHGVPCVVIIPWVLYQEMQVAVATIGKITGAPSKEEIECQNQ